MYNRNLLSFEIIENMMIPLLTILILSNFAVSNLDSNNLTLDLTTFVDQQRILFLFLGFIQNNSVISGKI